MMVQQINQDVVANNLANVNTTGYKKDRAVVRSFPEMLMRRMHDFSPPEPGQTEPNPIIGRLGTGAVVDRIWTDHSHSGLRVTNTPTDLAIIGRGYFVVNTPDGERYTSNGQFTTRPDGTLVTSEGYEVQGQNGNITVPQGRTYSVDSTGRVLSDGQEIGRLRLVGFDELAQGQESPISKQGDSLYRLANQQGVGQPGGQQGGGPALRELLPNEMEIQAGALETSNVNAVQEMVQMIALSRAYESNQKAIQAQDGTLEKACGELGRA